MNDFRVAAAVAQTNCGFDYVQLVLAKLNLTIGQHTKAHAQRMNKASDQHVLRSCTKQSKYRRLILRAKRSEA